MEIDWAWRRSSGAKARGKIAAAAARLEVMPVPVIRGGREGAAVPVLASWRRDGGCAIERTFGGFLNAGVSVGRRVQKYPGMIRVPHFCPLGLEVRKLIRFQPIAAAENETPGKCLLADTEFGNDALVTLGIVFLEVVEQATPLADQHEKTAARAVILLVRLEVLRQLANALAEQRDLHLGTAGVGRVRAVAVNNGFLLLSG